MEKIIFAGAHPDDFTSCCGTALRMKEYYDVYLWDFTRGERGLTGQGVSMEECGAMRTKEEEKVAELAGVHLEFLGEVDGEAFASRERCEYIAARLKELNPRAVFTHFVPDTHPDHIMTCAAMLKAIQLAGIHPEIYFFEFSHQSLGFIPEYFVDVSSVMEQKIEIIRTYACQNMNDSIVKNKVEIGHFRGLQSGYHYAETYKKCGFIRAGEPTVFDVLK